MIHSSYTTDWLIYHTLHACSATAQTLLKLPSREDRVLVLSSKYNNERADFTDCMSFQPSIPIEEISPHPKSLSTNV